MGVGVPDAVCLMTRGGALIASEENPMQGEASSHVLPRNLHARIVRTTSELEGEGDVIEINSSNRRLVVARGKFGILIVPIQGWVSPAVGPEISRFLKEIEDECGEALTSWTGGEGPVHRVKPYLQRVLRNVTSIQTTDWATNFAVTVPAIGGLTNRMKVKVCLVGETAADKTALIRGHVLDNFDDRYVQTLGTAVSKKELRVASPAGSGEMMVDMTVWDIMGQKGFRELLKEAYFYGARGILAVCDVTRRKTLEDLDDWIEGVYSVTGKIPIEFLGNKIDLKDQQQISEDEMVQAARAYDSPFHFTSAKAGVNVEIAFQSLAERVAKERYARKVVAEE